MGGKPPDIAVTAFENKVKMFWWDVIWRIGEGLAEMLTTELMRTGRFIVVERQGLGDIVREQELGQSGLIRRETAPPPGQLMGAQVVVRGAITEFEARSSGGGAGVRSLSRASTRAPMWPWTCG
jgi:curli biogenesis system outer membrane secretion channel CsgG